MSDRKQVLILAREADFFAEKLAKAVPAFRYRGATTAANALPFAANCEILLVRDLDDFGGLTAAMPHLKWIQALTTGTSGIEHLAGLSKDVVITAARGFHGPQMSELAFLLMLSLTRRFKTVLANQAAAKWERRPQSLLFGKTAVIVGVGATSEQLALRCKAFGMTVFGVSSSRREVLHFDEIFPRTHLRDAAARADFLIVLAPSNADTRHLVGRDVLTSMRASAFLINIARGELVDTAALIDVLREKRIAGAGLDVFETTPLPPSSPLWTMDNVIVTPHVGGMSDIYAEQVLPILIENLSAYAAGHHDALRFVVQR